MSTVVKWHLLGVINPRKIPGVSRSTSITKETEHCQSEKSVLLIMTRL